MIYLTKLMKQGSSSKVYNACPQIKLKYKFINILHYAQHKGVKYAIA
jgi:hypothetical protein